MIKWTWLILFLMIYNAFIYVWHVLTGTHKEGWMAYLCCRVLTSTFLETFSRGLIKSAPKRFGLKLNYWILICWESDCSNKINIWVSTVLYGTARCIHSYWPNKGRYIKNYFNNRRSVLSSFSRNSESIIL